MLHDRAEDDDRADSHKKKSKFALGTAARPLSVFFPRAVASHSHAPYDYGLVPRFEILPLQA